MQWFNNLKVRAKLMGVLLLVMLVAGTVDAIGVAALVLKDNSSVSKLANLSVSTTVIVMVAIMVVGTLIAIALGLLISRSIGTPIQQLMEAAERIAAGDLNLDVEVKGSDEIGALATSFRKMLTTLNEVMLNVNSASEQVAIGANNISLSSTSLSQGATEQASAIEELNASITEISSQTNLNAQNANAANDLVAVEKTNAILGNEQMQKMLKAMEEINQASLNISRIIKTIDEIAFQTNILALNAAIEAARAGQHGKGFAVVAEEVRNLAVRSADAAKETTAMIEGSIHKVEEGTKIANNTAQALKDIIDGFAKVAELVGDIAIASREQATGIAQVTQGIAEVAQVVQTTSAASEKGAASSEELAGQAQHLKQQAQRFKLRIHSKKTGSQSNVVLMPQRVLPKQGTVSIPLQNALAETAATNSTKVTLEDL